MNIQQLEYIIAVDRLKNFTKAAEYCNVTQATLSAMVKKLEQELGIVIFDRKKNPTETTEIGIETIENAKKVVLHSQLLKDNAKKSIGKIEGKIRIGIIPTIANSLLPKILKPILENFPDLKLEISEQTTNSITKQLKEGQLDMGIVATPLHDTEIEDIVLFYETLMVYGDIDPVQNYILPDEIRNHKIWLLEEGHCLREQFIKLCSLKKKEKMVENLKLEASSFDTLLNMIDEFGGLTLIPELYYNTLSTERKKQVSFFNAPIPVREMSIIYHRPYAKIRTIEALAKIIHSTINKDLISNKYKKSELAITQI
ncbi:hydrogen peroxide-inducible genes activator [Flavobacterium sp. GSP27]|uniref:Hydrogen peroxide-inducible genes activator n=1 Tax=Flavobacterium bomense TaxID=2497483 RepID=A0A432CHT3_9FLAO|nr:MULTISPECIES: hydrogen peroxide-inducible genes activator [Flavobacterium]RTY93792.1 hydrogen peroxide-inducible genes activator [Flavobacterium sp. GSN2]RTY73709.1 hydrogen peroxide-inducible genes activator [Flavobacterium sp. LS1R10]RTY86684.1 hydrogen peroxide-inducible genes activator [Flavobacterium sp. RSP15]RTZ01637.1 hydrogen peroxide-inducible genes activator [Flavobacterium sp. RSP49]RTZ02640.1 hydrogen peroxide-inducible genes activator [Flavobacterium bomense]